MVVKNKANIAALLLVTLIFIFLVYLPVSAANFTTWSTMNSGTTKDLNSVWGATGTNVFAVGNSGTIMHYNGSAWSSLSSGITQDLNSVWGTAAADAFAVGSSGTIVRYNGSAWSTMNSGTTKDLNSVWGATGTNVFAVGSSGTIVRYNGSAWSTMNSGTTQHLNSVWGTTGTNVFAVGSSGTIVRYNGSAWSTMNSGTTQNLNSVWGTAAADVFAVGSSGTIVRYNGSAWSTMNSGTTQNLNSVWGTAAADAFAVGSSGTIVRYNGSTWSSMNRDTLNELQAVWGISSVDVFTAGRSGTILRYIPPVIDSVSHNQGDQGATLNVTLTGTNLAGTSEVRFGTGIAVNSFSVLSANQIAVNITIVSSAETGVREVSVTTPGGSFALSNSFTVKQALPAITSVSPDQDRQGATLNVTITGANLTGANEVRLGTGIAVNSFSVLSTNQIAANITIVAGAETGARDVAVTSPGGSFTLSKSFTVKQALPSITSVAPNQGNQEATLTVTINGTALTGASEVRFGTGIVVNSYNIISTNQMAANITIVAGAETGARDMSVTTPGGSFTLSRGFAVKQALPVITSVSPDHGSQAATLTVTIDGANLAGASEVRLGAGIAVNSIRVLSTYQIAANITIVAGAETGARDMSVTTPGGSFALSNSFTVNQALPVITSISPDNGGQGETLTVIISGSNFDKTISISFGSGVTVQNFTSLSPTQLKVNVMIQAEAVTGSRDVLVTTPGGNSTLGNSFNIKERPLGVLFVVLIWAGIGVIVVLFILILNKLRQKRAAKI